MENGKCPSNSGSVPDRLAEFNALDKHVSELFLQVALYKALFNNRDCVRRMNDYSGQSFSVIQRTFDRDFIRRLCAIADKPQKNLSIYRFADLEDSFDDASRKASLFSSFQQHMSPFWPLRHKHLMHHDLKHALSDSSPFKVSWMEIDSVMEILASLMNCVQIALGLNRTTRYESSIVSESGAIPWLLMDNERLAMLRKLSLNDAASSDMIRDLCKHRSSRNDALIFKHYRFSDQ